jgi:hypothetical protein
MDQNGAKEVVRVGEWGKERKKCHQRGSKDQSDRALIFSQSEMRVYCCILSRK